MNQLASNTTVELVAALLTHYSFDLGGATIGELIKRWLSDYPANWVRAAAIEALYRGRYKAISVDQMLTVWQRRGVALHQFNHEFERLVCADLPQTFGIVDLDDKTDANNQAIAQTRASVNTSLTTRIPANGKITQILRHNGDPSPIVRFSPPEAIASDFHSKLKAISRSQNVATEEEIKDG